MIHLNKFPTTAPMLKLAQIVVLLMTLINGHSLAASQIADRILVAINSIPYSQLQVERYLNVKESLRDNIQNSQTVQESNWSMALNVFIQDMMIHQDATKSSGFRPTKEAIQRLRFKTEKNLEQSSNFKASFDRLGLKRADVETELLKIATVENYRRGKKSLDTDEKSSSNKWEEELTRRSIVRYLDGAKSWIRIEPTP
jgi:hypothetical protein